MPAFQHSKLGALDAFDFILSILFIDVEQMHFKHR